MISNQKFSLNRQLAFKALSVLLILSFLVIAAPQSFQGARAQSCAKYHTVVSGDTLYQLALTYGVKWEDIVSANDLKSPYTLLIGQSLCIPAGTSTGATAVATATGTKTAAKADFTFADYVTHFYIEASGMPKNRVFYVRVGAGDFNTAKWVKVGRLRTDKNGAAKAMFRLPKSMRFEKELTICVKNALTDAVLCKWYQRYPLTDY